MSVAKYYPFNGSKNRLRLGLTSIPESEWIQYEKDLPERIAQKKKLIYEQPNRVIQYSDESLSAQRELLQNIISYLAKYKSDLFILNDSSITSYTEGITYEFEKYKNNPLELISYLVADDFCLLEKFNDDYRLVAGSVCSPTYWELSEKIGKPMKDVHAPIPNLEDRIGHMIRHFFSGLNTDVYYQRSNWFIMSNSDLTLFKDDSNPDKEINNLNISNIEDKLFLRSERQTFRKLSKTKNIAFGIKIYVSPLSILKKHTLIAEDLIQGLNTMSVDQKEIMGVSLYEDLLEIYLHGILDNKY
ncbi:MAG: DUF3445 domain-containing protein [Gammaproteobacteria bacterium]|nr:DUF3445 domain-containing protein [Gammaproteobacteria bacterium]